MKTPTCLALWCLIPCAFSLLASEQERTKTRSLESVLKDAKNDLIGMWSTDQHATVAYIAKRPNAGLKPPPFTSARVRELKLLFEEDGTMQVDGPMQTKATATARFVLTVDEKRDIYLITTYEESNEPHGHGEQKPAVARAPRKQVVTQRIIIEHDRLVTLFDGSAEGTQCTVYTREPSTPKDK